MKTKSSSHSLRIGLLIVAILGLVASASLEAIAARGGNKGGTKRAAPASPRTSQAKPDAAQPKTARGATLRELPGCNTNAAAGLSRQIFDQMQANGVKLVRLDTRTAKWYADSKPPPYPPTLAAEAAASLKAATRSKGSSITLISALESSAQQWLLLNWANQGLCSTEQGGLVPGSGDLGAGRTIATPYYTLWKSTLQAFGWGQSYPLTNPTFFSHLPSKNYNSENVKAFQQLWNAHNPDAKIPETGVFNSATDAAFKAAPSDGWR